MNKCITAGLLIMVSSVGLATAFGAENPNQIYAGTAKVDITPDEEFIIPEGGCAFRLPDDANRHGNPPKNIHDRIYARALVLKTEKTSLAIVSLDLVLFASEKAVREAKEKWGVDHVILSSTHTHSSMIARGIAPTPKGWLAWERTPEEAGNLLDWPGLAEDPWQAATEEKIVAVIGKAMQNLFPATVTAGKEHYESAYMAHNRRRIGPDGKATPMWDNPNRLPTKPIDPTVGFIQVNDTQGKPRAFLVHYACHPVGMAGSGLLSRDFPGATVDYVEEQLGGDCMGMFLQGALGDLDPYDMNFKNEHGYNLMRLGGISIAKGALKAARNAEQAQAEVTPSLEITETMVKIPYRNGDKFTEGCILTAVINDKFALVTMPGEIFVQHQLDINEKSPLTPTFLLGQAYVGSGSPWLRYIPTVQAVKEGGFGASITEYSFIAADAGEMMVDKGVENIKKLETRH